METNFEPIPSYWIAAVGDLDRKFAPGILAELLEASAHRKHVVAAVLAHRQESLWRQTSGEAAVMARQLVSGKLATLIQDYIGTLPDGFLGALARVSECIQSPHFYVRLFRVYSDREHHRVVRALKHVHSLNEDKLDVVVGAEPILLESGGWKLVRNVRQRTDLEAAIPLIKNICDTDDREIARSLSIAVSSGNLRSWVSQWLNQSNFPPAPDVHPLIAPVASAAEKRLVALEFRNCLAERFLLGCLAGTEAFYTTRSTAFEPMVVRITRDDESEQWELVEVHLKRNRAPTAAARGWVEEQFAAIGIKQKVKHRLWPEKWRPVERCLNQIIDEDDLDELLEAYG